MLTVQQFRSQYNLSESQFKRLRQSAEQRSGHPVTQRQGSSTWVITDESALLAVLPEKTPDEPLGVSSAIVPVIVENHPETADKLALVAEKLATLTPRPVRTLDLNGAQNDIGDLLIQMTDRVEAKRQLNQGLEQELQTRRDRLEQVRHLATQVAQASQSEDAQTQEIMLDAREIKGEETDLKKQLAQLLQSLG